MLKDVSDFGKQETTKIPHNPFHDLGMLWVASCTSTWTKHTSGLAYQNGGNLRLTAKTPQKGVDYSQLHCIVLLRILCPLLPSLSSQGHQCRVAAVLATSLSNVF